MLPDYWPPDINDFNLKITYKKSFTNPKPMKQKQLYTQYLVSKDGIIFYLNEHPNGNISFINTYGKKEFIFVNTPKARAKKILEMMLEALQ